MKALTVRQPWAWAIIRAGKDVENRTTRWRYTGPLAIHAGLSTDPLGVRSVAALAPGVARPRVYYRGAVIGVVELLGCHWSRPGCCESPWAEMTIPGLAHLELGDPRPLTYPVPTRGSLGLWNLEPDVEALVLADLELAP